MNRFLISFFCIIFCLDIQAVPARKGVTTITLPDGSLKQVVLHGDEYCHWMTTTDGKAYGQRVVNSALVERASKANNEFRRISHKKAPRTNSMLLDGSFPTTGKRRLLALLINFANTTPTFPREHFDAMLNEEGYNGVGSFRDYYLDQSGGQLDIQTTVTPWVTVSQSKQFYNIDNTPSLISEALKLVDDQIDLRDFDNDGDGILDGLIVIHAGEGQEASGNSTDIWSHSSTVYGIQFDGINLFRYTIEPELLHSSTSTIGVFCHEFGHNLGALDYYDTNYSSGGEYGGTGPWDIMGSGAWNGSGGLGTHPAPFTAWQRWQFGWAEPTILSESKHVSYDKGILSDVCDGGYLMNTTADGDYFVLENVQHIDPWTSDLPGHGLIVTHVIESIVRQRMSMNNINATYPQGIYTVCADAHSDPEPGIPATYGDLTSSATPFPGTRNHDTFSDETLPSSHSQDGRFGYVALQKITEKDGVVSFDFIQGEAPQKPVDLNATVKQGVVRLTWTFPEAQDLPTSCNIYTNGVVVGVRNSPASSQGRIYDFSDNENTASGLVTYSVDAVYANGLTSAVASVNTRIPPLVVSDLQGVFDEENGSFELSWNTPNELTRCVNDLHYELVDHYTTALRYAHRFRADDLKPYIGREIRSITFLPQQRSTDASYFISVWRMPAKDGELCPMTIPADALELVAQRKVSEFSPSYIRTTPFVTRPKIERGYDYFIGVEIQSNGLAEVVTDQSELLEGFGNMMSVNGGAWQVDPLALGNYILSATLAGEVPWYESDILIVNQDNTAVVSTLFDTFTSPYAADQDLLMPLGFTIYANDIRIGETTASTFSLPVKYMEIPNSGTVEFKLVCAYKHNNESRTLSITIPYNIPSSVLSLEAAAAPQSYTYDISGRIVSNASLQRGVTICNGKKLVR